VTGIVIAGAVNSLVKAGMATVIGGRQVGLRVGVPLSPRGREDARKAARTLGVHKVVIDVCFTSLLIRAIETAVICLTEGEGVCAGRSPVLKHAADDPDWHGRDRYEGEPAGEVPVFLSQSLNERYYGRLQGLNKRQTAERVGEATVQQWRRAFPVQPPGGESLADTAYSLSGTHPVGCLSALHCETAMRCPGECISRFLNERGFAR